MVAGWPPKGNKAGGAGPAQNYKTQRENGGLDPGAKRSGTERPPFTGTPASDDFRFPTRPLMPTKESNE